MLTTETIWKKINEDALVIAELGKAYIQTQEEQPWSAYLDNAKKLIAAAREAGADVVKFQTHVVDDEQLDVPITAPHFSLDRHAWVQRLTESSPIVFWREIKRYCDELDIAFFSTPMSRKAAQLLDTVEVPLWKVASSDCLDFVLLDYLAATGKPIILSSGMSTVDELDQSVAFLKKRTDRIALLHCVSKYPCPPEELYLDTIDFFAKRYRIPVGFSDHSLGYQAAVAAVGKGARIIEKHFTLDRSLWGSDHKVSMLPEEFAAMVQHISSRTHISPESFGKGIKELDEEESMFRPVFRKSLVAGQDMLTGTTITKDMLYAMRPQQHAAGLPSEAYEHVLGKRVARDVRRYEPIIEELFI